MKAIKNWVIIIPELEEKHNSLEIAKPYRDYNWRGTVISVGEGCEGIEVGKRYIYKTYAGFSYKGYLFLKREDILAEEPI